MKNRLHARMLQFVLLAFVLSIALVFFDDTNASATTYVINPIVNVYSYVPDAGPTVINDPEAPITVVNYAYRSIPYVKFDLSSIPDSEQVLSATLRLFELGDWYDLPDVIDLFYSSDDNWDENTGYYDLPLKTGGLIHQSSYPSAWSTWQEWDLSSHAFSGDLADNYLTLILESNVSSPWRGTRFCSITRYDNPDQIPQLVIITDGNGGSCVGSVEASTYKASPVYGSSDLANHLAFFLLPIGGVIGLGIWRRRK